MLTFAGLVRQGGVTNQVHAYEWTYSSMVPEAGLLCSDLHYTPATNDTVYIWGATNYARISSYAVPFGGGAPVWDAGEPSLALGQSFVLSPGATNRWTNNFTTCQ